MGGLGAERFAGGLLGSAGEGFGLLDGGRRVAEGPPGEVLTEEILRRVYRCEVTVDRHRPDGSIAVFPRWKPLGQGRGRGVRVHVVGGGGCAAEVLRVLCLEDYTVTSGVLNQGDSDAVAAEALGVETALEKPFSPVGPEALDKARALVRSADAVVVCAVPFGPGNVVNLDLAEEALGAGKKVFLATGTGTRDYSPGGVCAAKAAELVRRGAVEWNDAAGLADLLAATRLGVRVG